VGKDEEEGQLPQFGGEGTPNETRNNTSWGVSRKEAERKDGIGRTGRADLGHLRPWGKIIVKELKGGSWNGKRNRAEGLSNENQSTGVIQEKEILVRVTFGPGRKLVPCTSKLHHRRKIMKEEGK